MRNRPTSSIVDENAIRAWTISTPSSLLVTSCWIIIAWP
jgi:hypothetical protein